MARKLQARYVPIGSSIEQMENPNAGKSIQELDAESKKGQPNYAPIGSKPEEKPRASYQPLGSQQTTIKQEQEETLQPIEQVNEKPEIEEIDLFAEFDEDDFNSSIESVKQMLEEKIDSGEIAILTEAEKRTIANLAKMEEQFDDVFTQTASTVEYEIKDEAKVEYSKEISKASKKLDKLEQSVDYVSYQNELRLRELEDRKLRVNRYKKRKLEGIEELGVDGQDHHTSEKNVKIESEVKRGPEENVERRAFRQDYEGSDLEGIDRERDRLEREILSKQEKAPAKKSKKKTEEDKIAEAKERLRKKQEKRRAKQMKKGKKGDEVVPEIDLVGNQFDIDEMREEKMDRLLEIKRISAERKELQKKKEQQRSKATKEFYKYRKVNKKSHIVGFKQ